MVKVTKNMTFAEVIQMHPSTVPIFLQHGLACVGCPFASQETIEQGAMGHKVDADDLLKDLNEHIKQKEKEQKEKEEQKQKKK